MFSDDIDAAAENFLKHSDKQKFKRQALEMNLNDHNF